MANSESHPTAATWKLKIRRQFEVLCIKVLISLIQVLPFSGCVRICRFLAWVATDLFRFRKRVIWENIRGVYPDATDERCHYLTKEMWHHLFLMGCEIAHAPRKIHDTNWRNHVFIRDKVRMTEYLIDYRPLIAVSGHFGNFEMAGFVTGLLGMPSYTVARKLDNEYLDQFINAFRSRNGQFILPKDGSANQIQEALESGAILTMLGDQHAGTKGCWVEFLGRPASCHKAVALFTLGGNAPMMVSYCKHTDEPLFFEIGCTGIADPMDLDKDLQGVRALTEWYNDALAVAIYEQPEQYWWVHRRWKEKPVRKTKKHRERKNQEEQSSATDKPSKAA